MINRWQGNSGRVQRFPEQHDRAPIPIKKPESVPRVASAYAPPRKFVPPSSPPLYPPAKKPAGLLKSLEGLKKLIPGKAEELETEDLILLLILYLMYRESGDSELLMIMGAMFLL